MKDRHPDYRFVPLSNFNRLVNIGWMEDSLRTLLVSMMVRPGKTPSPLKIRGAVNIGPEAFERVGMLQFASETAAQWAERSGSDYGEVISEIFDWNKQLGLAICIEIAKKISSYISLGGLPSAAQCLSSFKKHGEKSEEDRKDLMSFDAGTDDWRRLIRDCIMHAELFLSGQIYDRITQRLLDKTRQLTARFSCAHDISSEQSNSPRGERQVKSRHRYRLLLIESSVQAVRCLDALVAMTIARDSSVDVHHFTYNAVSSYVSFRKAKAFATASGDREDIAEYEENASKNAEADFQSMVESIARDVCLSFYHDHKHADYNHYSEEVSHIARLSSSGLPGNVASTVFAAAGSAVGAGLVYWSRRR